MAWDRNGFLESERGAVPTRFVEQCPFSPVAPSEDELVHERFGDAAAMDQRIGRFEAAYVGHAVEDTFRENGSSGGLTSWVAAAIATQGSRAT